MVRKFIILDIYQTQPAVVFALAAASLSLGVVFWLVRNEDAAGSHTGTGSETKDADHAPQPSPMSAILPPCRGAKKDRQIA
jgi:hypothetical protein